VNPSPAARAVTFDFGHVLASFDAAYLVEKLARRGLPGKAPKFEAALPQAWHEYGRSLQGGATAEVAWKTLLRVILQAGDVEPRPSLLDDLFREQTHDNLWRNPVAGMIELARELRGQGVPVGIISNSEGGLLALLHTLGWNGIFSPIADSGVLGMEKPHAPIFRWAAEQLHVAPEEIIHIGDSWVADIEGARGVGARAIWFLAGISQCDRDLPDHVRFAGDAEGVRAILQTWEMLGKK